MAVALKQLRQDGATNGQVLTFNTTTGLWEAKTPVDPTSFSVSDQALDAIATGDGVILVDSMTRTPGAGNFLVFFDTTVTLSANNSEAEFSVFVNAVEVTDSRRQVGRAGGSTAAMVMPRSLHARVTGVGAGEAIEIRAGVDAGTVSIFERTLSLLKVA